ncbi:UNVERIFIED_CONTAM: protein transport protein Sec61 subunit beta [Sesamum radiatum]|uniref:Protein transport protein Sec61 subunit beta n=1 Tax=Sesamum radiatum TaxID=300843 RepID=A0AAW2VBZ9_SESRA
MGFQDLHNVLEANQGSRRLQLYSVPGVMSSMLFMSIGPYMLLLCSVLTIEIVVAGMATGGAAPQRGTAAAAAANLRRRRTAGGGAAGGASGTMLQFYTDDAPGLKISPNVVLVMSIGFIAFVAILHVMGKLYFVRKE